MEPRRRADQPCPTVPREAVSTHGPCMPAEGMALEHIRGCGEGLLAHRYRVAVSPRGSRAPVADPAARRRCDGCGRAPEGLQVLPEDELLASRARVLPRRPRGVPIAEGVLE